jgi:hypothetical protein
LAPHYRLGAGIAGSFGVLRVCGLAALLLALAAARHAWGTMRNRSREEICHDDVDIALAEEAIGG